MHEYETAVFPQTRWLGLWSGLQDADYKNINPGHFELVSRMHSPSLPRFPLSSVPCLLRTLSSKWPPRGNVMAVPGQDPSLTRPAVLPVFDINGPGPGNPATGVPHPTDRATYMDDHV